MEFGRALSSHTSAVTAARNWSYVSNSRPRKPLLSTPTPFSTAPLSDGRYADGVGHGVVVRAQRSELALIRPFTEVFPEHAWPEVVDRKSFRDSIGSDKPVLHAVQERWNLLFENNFRITPSRMRPNRDVG